MTPRPRSRPLRVLYSFPHPIGTPGIGTTAINQVRGLVARGLSVTLCCSSVAGDREGLPGAVHETLVVAGRRVPRRVVGFDRAVRHHDRRVAGMLRRSPESFDIVHGWPLGSVATFSAARTSGVPSVRESPNCYTAVAYQRVAAETERLGLEVPRGSSHEFDARRLATEESEYDLASAVLAPSAAVARSYLERRGPPIRLLRHRYGFDPSRFPVPSTWAQDRPFQLCFVGSCEPRKGLHFALDAWRGSNLGAEGCRFVIVGRWEPAYRRFLEAQLASPGVELREFTDDVGDELRRADALVLPSIEEGSALVTYEGQASGCALLVSDAAGALMDDGVHGFVHPVGDVDRLRGQLERVARDRHLRSEMQTAALDHRDELSWSTAAAHLEDAYVEAIGR